MVLNFHHVHMTPRVLYVCRSVPAQIKATYLATVPPTRLLYFEQRVEELGVGTDALDAS